MKHILTLFLLLTLTTTQAQLTTPYVEVNAGFSTGAIPFFPGASVLYGATTKYNSGILFDYQAGIAFPTLITFKGGIGYDINGTEISVGLRPWPPSTYGQVKIDRRRKQSDIILTVENTLFNEELFSQYAIFTIGWRWENKKYRDIKK